MSKLINHAALCALSLVWTSNLYAADSAREVAGEIASVSGIVFIRADGAVKASALRPAKAGDMVYAGDVINTSSNAGLKILLKDKTVVDLGPSTLFKVNDFKKEGGADRKVDLQVAFGSVRAAVTQKLKGSGAFKIRTPSATMGVRGTITHTQVNLPTANGRNGQASSTFLITQGQGVVTGNGAGAGAAPIVLNPGQQATSAGQGAPVNHQTLSPQEFSVRQAQVNNLTTNSDTAFQLATNFDKALEQQQQQQASNGNSNNGNGNGNGNGNSSTAENEDKDKDKGDKNGDGHADNGKEGNGGNSDRGPASEEGTSDSSTGGTDTTASGTDTAAGGDTASSGTDSGADTGSANSIMDNIATVVETIAPATPEITVADTGVTGVSSAADVLTEAAAPAGPVKTHGKIQINVMWR